MVGPKIFWFILLRALLRLFNFCCWNLWNPTILEPSFEFREKEQENSYKITAKWIVFDLDYLIRDWKEVWGNFMFVLNLTLRVWGFNGSRSIVLIWSTHLWFASRPTYKKQNPILGMFEEPRSFIQRKRWKYDHLILKTQNIIKSQYKILTSDTLHDMKIWSSYYYCLENISVSMRNLTNDISSLIW